MKKILLIVAIAVCVSLAGCVKKDYKAEGQKLAAQLEEICQKQDTAALMQLDNQIRAMEQEVLATGDTAAIAGFQSALKAAREKAAALVITVKMDNGVEKDSAMKELSGDVMNGGMDIQTAASAIDAALEKEQQNEKK